MKNVKDLPRRSENAPASVVRRGNVRVFPTGTAPKKAGFQPPSLSAGVRSVMTDEFKEHPFRLIAAFVALIFLFFWLFIGVPVIFG